MSSNRVPSELRERLGDEATLGLLALLESERAEWGARVLSVAADRFERRLSEEISGVRVELSAVRADIVRELHEGLGSVRQEMHAGLGSVRQEVHAGLGSVRQEMHAGLGSVRQELATARLQMHQALATSFGEMRQEIATSRVEMHQELAASRVEMHEVLATSRVETLRWSFLFWVGQVAAMAGLFALMFRLTGR